MCVTLPWQVVSVDGETARVRADGRELLVNCLPLPDLAAGDWVLVNAGICVGQLSDEAAAEVTQILSGTGGASSDVDEDWSWAP